jgi:FtsH-binding integral membrane protein
MKLMYMIIAVTIMMYCHEENDHTLAHSRLVFILVGATLAFSRRELNLMWSHFFFSVSMLCLV